MNANVSLRASAVLPRVHECRASAMPGCVRATTRPGCPPWERRHPAPASPPGHDTRSTSSPPPLSQRPRAHAPCPPVPGCATGRARMLPSPGTRAAVPTDPDNQTGVPREAKAQKRRSRGSMRNAYPGWMMASSPPAQQLGPARCEGGPSRHARRSRLSGHPCLKGWSRRVSCSGWRMFGANDVVRTTGMLAALSELIRIKLQSKKDARDANPAKNSDIARDPRFSQLLEQVWARWEDDPGSFTNRDLDSLARNLAKLGGDASKGLDRMEGEAMQRLSSMDSRGIAGIVWAFAKAGRGDTIFDAMGVQLLQRGFGSFNAQDISNIAWAFTTAGMQGVAGALCMQPWGFHARVQPTGLCKPGVGVCNSKRGGSGAVCSRGSRAGKGTPALYSAVEAWVEGRALRGFAMAREPAAKNGEGRFERVYVAAEAGKQQPGPSSSDLHLEVSKVLRGMAIDHENEVCYFHGLLYVDILVDGKVAVEVDGPSHFYQDSGAITAQTVFKKRLLEKGGFKVVSVPYYDWVRLKGRAAGAGNISS
eukprot:jgi/Mesvir1/24835/Mv22073-RA.1